MNLTSCLSPRAIAASALLSLSFTFATPAQSNDFDDLLAYDAVSDAVDVADEAIRSSRFRHHRFDRRYRGYKTPVRSRHSQSKKHRTHRHGTHHRRR